MKPAIFHREAEAELEDAIAWYESKRAGLGSDLQEQVEVAVVSIRTKPIRHPKYKDQGVRNCRVKRFPYTVYFLELDEIIWIAAVAHHKRKPDYWATRDPHD